MMELSDRERAYGAILRAAFKAEGLPVEWGMAIARQESCFEPATKVLTGGDAALGGSYGLCCMSLDTAKGLGYTGIADGLLDPTTNATLAAKYCRQLCDQFGGDLGNLRDVAAGYNSGKPWAKAPKSTRTVYVPNVMRYAAFYAKAWAYLNESDDGPAAA